MASGIIQVANENRAPTTTYVLLTAVAAFWAGNLITGKLAVALIPPFTLASLRFAVMTACLIVLMRLKKEPWPAVGARDILSFAILGLTGVAGFFGLYLFGLKFAPSSDGGLIQGTTPLLASVMACAIADEKATWWKGIGLIVSLFGVGIVVLSRSDVAAVYAATRLTGDLAFVGAVICWAIYAAYGRATMRRFSSLSMTTYSTIIGLLVLVPLAFTENSGSALMSAAGMPYAWALVAYIALIAGFFCFISWNEGVRQIGAARAGAFYNLMPVFAFVFASVFLGEHIGLPHVAGAILVVLGAWLTNKKSPAPVP